ncbi:MAG TPA: tetratricopeptide repeat protein [Tepidisphaeraceae bacterium]
MARRVNTKFLVIFSVIVVGGVLAGFLVMGPFKTLIRGDRSKKLIEQGDALVKEADAAQDPAVKKDKLETANRDYQQALATDTKNIDLYVKVGDLLSKLAQFDVYTYINQSRQAWDKALELNPTYLPALRRLQDSYYDEAQIGNPQTTYFTRLEDRATAIHKLDPNDLRAHSLMYIAPLNQWLANIETPQDKVRTAIDELTTLIEKNPDAPELPDMVFFVAGAKAKQGVEAKRGGQDRQGDDLLKAAAQTFDDVIKHNDRSANLYYRYFELLSYLRQQDPEKDSTARYTERMKVALENARTRVTRDDRNLFIKVYIAANQVALQQRDPKRAQTFLLDLYNEFPDDQRVRLALARLWRYDPAKQAEAIALLERPMIDTGFTGVQARQKLDLEVKTLAELATMYIERYANLAPGERPEALKTIEATYDKLFAKAHERSDVLKIRGKIELLRGGPDAPVKAIQTFEKAQTQYGVETNGREDLDLTFLLAKSYFASHQTGQAKSQLQKFIQRMPDYGPARMMLAQVLIAEGDTDGAREHVEYLEKMMPDDPDVVRLKLAVLKSDDTATARTLFAKLPEATYAERINKAGIANLAPVSNPDEALRLYKLVLAENPADFQALQGAKEVLVNHGKKDEAMALLQAGKAKADVKTAEKIALVIDQLQGASTAVIKEKAEELLRKQFADDPFTLEIKLYEFFVVAGNRPEGFKHLQAAEKLKPDDSRVRDMMFQYHLSAHDWDKAAWYVDRLAEQNADQANGLIYRFKLAMARGDVAGATDHAREMTTQLKEFARSWVFYGQALQAAGRYEDAIPNYTVALEKQSENPEAIAGIIACYMQLNKPTEAIRYIDRGLKAHPNNAFFKEQWKNYQMQWGNPAEVIKPALADRDANPKDPNRWLALGRAQYAAARKKDKDSDKFLADARATFTEALKQWPGEKAFWAYQVELAEFRNDPAGAEAVLKEMVARPEFKDSPEPTMALADHYLRANDAANAEATMKQAVERFKDNNEVRRRLAAYYTQNNRYDDAMKLLDPASPDKLVRQQIVEIYMLSKKFADAERMLRGLIASNEKDAQLHALLGVVLLNQGQTERAVDSLTTALTIDPKNQAALYSRGAIRLGAKTPQLDEAIKDFIALRDANPNHVEARVSLAEAFRQKQQFDAAARELEEALRRQPMRRDIRTTLIALYANSIKPPQWQDAERLLTQAKQLEPREILWRRMLAKMYSERELKDKAVNEILEAFAQDSKNAQEVKGYQPNGELIGDYLDILEKAKMYTRLAEESDRLLQDPAKRNTAWWAYMKRGTARANTDHKAEAMADFQTALSIADKTGVQDVQIAIVDKLREALGTEAAKDRVLQLAMKSTGNEATRWKIVLAYLYLQDNDLKQAESQIDDVLRDAGKLEERNRLTAMSIAGSIYMMSQQYEKGRKLYEELLQKRSDDLGALNNLACIMAEHVNPPNIQKALEYCDRAYDAMNKRRDPEASVLDTVGWVNVLAGGNKVDRGIELLNSSLKAGEIPEAYYHLGKALMLKNIPDSAKRNFTRANELIQEKMYKKQSYDTALKQKVDQALAEVEKALLEPRAGTP